MKTKKQIFVLNLAKELINTNNGEEDGVWEDYLANDFDDNYYGEGSLLLCGQEVDVESIWTDEDQHINIHVNHPDFEGDVMMRSLSAYNQIKIVDMMLKHD